MAKKGAPALDQHSLGVLVLAKLAEGKSLRSVCAEEGMPGLTTVMKWCRDDEAFAKQYASAREARAEVMFEELDEVSEEAASAETAVEVAGLRLKADNIKWKLARMSPKKYGDKVETTHSGEIKTVSRIELVGLTK